MKVFEIWEQALGIEKETHNDISIVQICLLTLNFRLKRQVKAESRFLLYTNGILYHTVCNIQYTM